MVPQVESDALQAICKCHSVLTMRCAFRRCDKVAVDSVDRHNSAGKLFQVSGLETSKFLQPVAVCCTSSLLEATDFRCRNLVRWTTGRQSSARYGGARPRRHLLTSTAILYCIRLATSAVLKGSVWLGRIYGFRWSSAPQRFELFGASERRSDSNQWTIAIVKCLHIKHFDTGLYLCCHLGNIQICNTGFANFHWLSYCTSLDCQSWLLRHTWLSPNSTNLLLHKKLQMQKQHKTSVHYAVQKDVFWVSTWTCQVMM